jgi:hypothetical protein
MGLKPPMYETQIPIRNAVNAPTGRERNAIIKNQVCPPMGPIGNQMEQPVQNSVQSDSNKPRRRAKRK